MSDEELLYLTMCGNEWAMEELYYSYSRCVRNIAREIICRNQCLIELEEMISEISMIFMNILYQYRSDKNASLSTFFKKCVRYRIYTMLKQYYSQLKSVPLSIDEYIIDEKTYEDYALRAPITQIPDNAMIIKENEVEYGKYAQKELTSIERKVYHYMELGYSTDEITQILNISAKSCYNAAYRVSKKLHICNMRLTSESKCDTLK